MWLLRRGHGIIAQFNKSGQISKNCLDFVYRLCYNACMGRKEIMRKYLYKTKYSITAADYDLLLWLQNGCCPVCGKHCTSFDKKLDVEHNHRTGRIRGLVCTGCNRLIGKYEQGLLKNKKKIRKVEDYLCFTLDI